MINQNGIVRLVEDVRTTAATGATLLQRVDSLVAESMAPQCRSAHCSRCNNSVADATTTISSLNRPAGGLIAPLGTARRDFDEEIEKTIHDLGRGDRTLSYVLSFLGADGARTYLIAGEINAEMRDQGDVVSLATHACAVRGLRSGPHGIGRRHRAFTGGECPDAGGHRRGLRWIPGH
jgi:hypothetical protein